MKEKEEMTDLEIRVKPEMQQIHNTRMEILVSIKFINLKQVISE